MPSCVSFCFSPVQQCPDPGEVVNGARSVRPEAGFAVGTVVRFSCNQGYQLEGPSQISCHGRDTGTPKWSDRSPKCVCKSRPYTLLQLLFCPCFKTLSNYVGFFEQWNMTRVQTLASLIMVTRPCTSTATRQEKHCASSVMKAMSLLVRSSSAVSPGIPPSGTAHRHFAKVNVCTASYALLWNFEL